MEEYTAHIQRLVLLTSICQKQSRINPYFHIDQRNYVIHHNNPLLDNNRKDFITLFTTAHDDRRSKGNKTHDFCQTRLQPVL